MCRYVGQPSDLRRARRHCARVRPSSIAERARVIL